MKNEDRCDNLLKLLNESGGHHYWCKWCQRHLHPDPVAYKEGQLLFIHGDAYHPPNCVFESGDEHRLQ